MNVLLLPWENVNVRKTKIDCYNMNSSVAATDKEHFPFHCLSNFSGWSHPHMHKPFGLCTYVDKSGLVSWALLVRSKTTKCILQTSFSASALFLVYCSSSYVRTYVQSRFGPVILDATARQQHQIAWHALKVVRWTTCKRDMAWCIHDKQRGYTYKILLAISNWYITMNWFNIFYGKDNFFIPPLRTWAKKKFFPARRNLTPCKLKLFVRNYWHAKCTLAV